MTNQNEKNGGMKEEDIKSHERGGIVSTSAEEHADVVS